PARGGISKRTCQGLCCSQRQQPILASGDRSSRKMEYFSHHLARAGCLPSRQTARRRHTSPAVLAWLSAFVEVSEELDRFTALGKSAYGVRARLRSEWPAETHSIPLYPAFRCDH